MSTYKEIKGTSVQSFSSDPGAPTDGQVWYNTSSNAIKIAKVFTTGSYATGGSLNTARNRGAAAGTQTAGLVAGGGVPAIAATEDYDGSAWTSGTNLPSARYGAGGAGTQTAALSFGGDLGPGNTPEFLAATEAYDGSTWTSGGAMAQSREGVSGAGTSTAALAFGGDVGPSATPGAEFYAVAEEYDGSTWTAGGSLSHARGSVGRAGTQTAALAFGGAPPPRNTTEEYDGTSWSSGGTMSTGRYGMASAGSQTAAFGSGGESPTGFAITEEYDGSSWTSGGNLNQARWYISGTGTLAAGLAIGGFPPTFTPTAQTEEYTGPGTVVTTIS